MTPQLIVLKSKRSEYKAADAAKKSVTVGELIDMLKQFDPSTSVVTTEDNYMYSWVESVETPKEDDEE